LHLRLHRQHSKDLDCPDSGIDDATRVVLTQAVVETLGQQGDLASVLSLDESLHAAGRSVRCLNSANGAHPIKAFSRGLDPLLPIERAELGAAAGIARRVVVSALATSPRIAHWIGGQ
jgi:hypothetical protein